VSRRIDFEEDALVVRYSGLDLAAVFKREVRVPYTTVAAVSVGLTDRPSVFAGRVGLSTAPFGITQRGRFREHGRWSFLDVDDPERAVVLALTGHAYRRVALTVDDPEAFAEQLQRRRG
jgi:hypothetical protein